MGRTCSNLSDNEIRQVRGNKIAMIFQDPMTSLNPVLTIGRQIGEALELHMGMNREEARKRSAELLEMVGIPEADRSPGRLSPPVLWRNAPAGHDRHGLGLQSPAAHRRRADHGARRDDPGPDRRTGQAAARRDRHGHHLDHPRPGGGRWPGRPDDGHVRRLCRGRGARSRRSTPIPAIPTPSAFWALCPGWMRSARTS